MSVLAALCIIAVAADAFLVEPHCSRSLDLRLPTSELERSLRVVVLADIQTQRVGEYKRRVIDAVVELEPDVVLLTGDYVQVPEPAYDASGVAFRELMHGLVSRTSARVYAVRGDVE